MTPQKLDPPQEALLQAFKQYMDDRPPACGEGNPTRIKDHLDNAKWEKRAIIVAFLSALGAVLATLTLAATR